MVVGWVGSLCRIKMLWASLKSFWKLFLAFKRMYLLQIFSLDIINNNLETIMQCFLCQFKVVIETAR